jgi:hypothetical protein
VLLTLPATAMGFALSVQISVLSWILATEYHLDIHQIGLVWAAGPLAGIVGQLHDRRDERSRLVLGRTTASFHRDRRPARVADDPRTAVDRPHLAASWASTRS